MSNGENVCDDDPGKPTYFHLVGNEILQILFRYPFNGGSELFNNKNDETHILVLASTHPLKPAIKHVFRSLKISGYTFRAVEFYISDRLEDSFDSLKIGKGATMDQVRAAVQEMKDSVEALEFSAVHWIEQDIQALAQILTTHCNNVTELRISGYSPQKVKKGTNDALGNIFRRFASQLKSLS